MQLTGSHKLVMLTPKQEKFCQKYLETGNASEAYRQSYSAEEMKPETIANKACLLLQRGDVRARLDELRAKVEKRHALTVDRLVHKLEAVYDRALAQGQLGAGVSAVMGMARLSGLDRQAIEAVVPVLIIRRP